MIHEDNADNRSNSRRRQRENLDMQRIQYKIHRRTSLVVNDAYG